MSDLVSDYISEVLHSTSSVYPSHIFERDYVEGVLGIQVPLNESFPYTSELRLRILEEEGKIRGFFSSLKQTTKEGWDIAMTFREACKDKASVEEFTSLALGRMKPKMKLCLSWLEYVKAIDEKVEPPKELLKKVGGGGGKSGLGVIYKPLLKTLPFLDGKVTAATGWRKVIWSAMALVSVEFVYDKIQDVGLGVLETAVDEFNVVAKEQGVDPIKKGSTKNESFSHTNRLILEAAGEAAKAAWIALYELIKKWSVNILKTLAKVATIEIVKATISAGVANVVSWFKTAFDGLKFVFEKLKPLMSQFKDWAKNKKQELKDALIGKNDPTAPGGASKEKQPAKPIKFEGRDQQVVIRQLIREVLRQEPETPLLPKGEWVLLHPGDDRREMIKDHLFGLVQSTYEYAGGHLKITSPASLDRYSYWVVNDLDDDPDADVVMMGRPYTGGSKLGASAHDGSSAAKSAYKNKSAELRKGGKVGGVGNWWGEVSLRPAYATLSRGAPAIEDEATVRALLAGKDITWHGQYPYPEESNPVFDAAKGWYTRGIGGHSAVKIIVGSPTI